MAWLKKEDVNMKLIEARKTLMTLESKFSARVRQERNAVLNAKTRASRVSAEERLRNAYVSLRLVHISQERLYDVSSTLELRGAMQELSKAVNVLNSIEKKSDKSIFFLNKYMKKILDRKSQSEAGGMKQYYDESIETLLMGESTMSGLLNPEIPLQAILQQDEETLENVDNFMAFTADAKDGYKGPITNSNDDDISDLLNAWGSTRG